MTGAQDTAFIRLKKRHGSVIVRRKPKRTTDDLDVTYQVDGALGPRSVNARITPQGRVIEQP